MNKQTLKEVLKKWNYWVNQGNLRQFGLWLKKEVEKTKKEG